ncbi:MAG TPA: alanine racemase [Candidatus Monoglobus merdigallinarum]|uniref:Alanine racemase n=1 Tax=Candidatus Monoglobus merdigallinarum TaxID=2838698 RepID=A0A9D1TLK7_9FIRM|nr:alanine racemase [Candidatus Monoglobus merdigallinarum]
MKAVVTEKRAWAEIDLNALSSNIKEIRRHVGDKTKIMAVVKADGYGHGYLETATAMIENGADALAVAFVDEAIQIRKCGIKAPVLILGYTHPDYADELIEKDIMPCCYTYEMAKAVSDAGQRAGRPGKIHIKIDTGMGRVGYRYNEDEEVNRSTIEEIVRISKLPSLEIDGIFTHFSVADEDDDGYTRLQFERFKRVCDEVSARGVKINFRHCCNSAALMRFPEYHMDMVRPGIILYGLMPSGFVDRSILKLTPAMTFKAKITNVKTVESGTSLSYGRRFKTERERTKIATVSIGYADGYSRILSGRAEIIVRGEKCRQVGNICMDQCMIDATAVNNISIGDEAILFGRSSGGEEIPVEEIAGIMGTINYEIVCVVGKRVPRVYLKDGRIVDVHNYLLDDPVKR